MIKLMILTVVLLTCALVCSCEDNSGPRVVQIIGTWAGVADDYLDIWPPDAPIRLTVTQHNSTVSGTLNASGYIDTLYSGTFQNNQLIFTLRHEIDDLEHEFTGHLERNRIEGIWRAKRLSTGKVWLSSTWYVEKVD